MHLAYGPGILVRGYLKIFSNFHQFDLSLRLMLISFICIIKSDDIMKGILNSDKASLIFTISLHIQ